jgi:hypothetical protein
LRGCHGLVDYPLWSSSELQTATVLSVAEVRRIHLVIWTSLIAAGRNG